MRVIQPPALVYFSGFKRKQCLEKVDKSRKRGTIFEYMYLWSIKTEPLCSGRGDWLNWIKSKLPIIGWLRKGLRDWWNFTTPLLNVFTVGVEWRLICYRYFYCNQQTPFCLQTLLTYLIVSYHQHRVTWSSLWKLKNKK